MGKDHVDGQRHDFFDFFRRHLDWLLSGKSNKWSKWMAGESGMVVTGERYGRRRPKGSLSLVDHLPPLFWWCCRLPAENRRPDGLEKMRHFFQIEIIYYILTLNLRNFRRQQKNVSTTETKSEVHLVVHVCLSATSLDHPVRNLQLIGVDWMIR